MKRKAIFLDRDGTINVEKNYLYKIEDFEFLSGVIPALINAQENGYLLIIITNQSGIARGYYTEDDYHNINNWMIEELKQNGVDIAGVYFCPHHPEATIEAYRVECDCRKPKIGLYKQAIDDFKIDVAKSFAIGDKIRDCSICEESECRGYLIADNEKPEVIKKVKAGEFKNVEYATDLREAIEKIVSRTVT